MVDMSEPAQDASGARHGFIARVSTYTANALGMFLLAVLANVAYCTVYAADLFVQFSGLDSAWRRGRLLVLAIGTAFAATITHFIVQGSL
jgi:hypothetical protein